MMTWQRCFLLFWLFFGLFPRIVVEHYFMFCCEKNEKMKERKREKEEKEERNKKEKK